ncbi:MAG TPA: glycosyltransferase family 4 protein [Thermoanaerobaculia bacterium]|jgi:glycosyltransferase involved in cell wall biosynthesis|nr:glycosyltransferase family 4 protein [Thermoanaerobaculia bacterium]
MPDKPRVTPRVAILSSEPIRPRMAGIGIRYAELARRLPGFGIEVRLISPAAPEEMLAAVPLEPGQVARFERGRLRALCAGCSCVIAQGQLGNDAVVELGSAADGSGALPVAIDLYDPWLIENFAYVETLGLDPYRNDHATWVLQMSCGDFFLCSSDEQRTFYLGFLAALGRVNPERLAGDPDLAGLIAPVPFGVPEELPPHAPYLPPRRPGEKRLLFGGLYDWYDPWTLLDALDRLDRPDWTLLLIANPNPENTPQRLLGEVEARCRRRGVWGRRVQLLDWVPSERRYDLLRDVDVLVAPHRPTLETRLSLRTRFLDALAAGCPVITSEGGAMSRMLVGHHAGRVVPAGDAEALGVALVAAIERLDGAAFEAGAARLLEGFQWERALAPLVAFCRDPRIDPTKERFARALPTTAPADGLAFRVRRRIHGMLGKR